MNDQAIEIESAQPKPVRTDVDVVVGMLRQARGERADNLAHAQFSREELLDFNQIKSALTTLSSGKEPLLSVGNVVPDIAKGEGSVIVAYVRDRLRLSVAAYIENKRVQLGQPDDGEPKLNALTQWTSELLGRISDADKQRIDSEIAVLLKQRGLPNIEIVKSEISGSPVGAKDRAFKAVRGSLRTPPKPQPSAE